MNVLIIEDEQLNAELLIEIIKEYDSDIQILAHCKSKQETIIWLEHNPQIRLDLVFSDIELLDGNVFTFLEENPFTSPIIFTTAYNDFYQEAFDANGIAYLLKPISFKKFSAAMQKFENLNRKESTPEIDWNSISQLIHKKQFKERIVIKNASEMTVHSTSNIAAILSNEGKCILVDEKGQEHSFKAKISELIQDLDPKDFFQINRGEIVNINFIEKIEPYFGDRLSVKIKNFKGHLITSASNTAEFRKWLQ